MSNVDRILVERTNATITHLQQHGVSDIRWMRVAIALTQLVTFGFLVSAALLPIIAYTPGWLPWTALGVSLVLLYIRVKLEAAVHKKKSIEYEFVAFRDSLGFPSDYDRLGAQHAQEDRGENRARLQPELRGPAKNISPQARSYELIGPRNLPPDPRLKAHNRADQEKLNKQQQAKIFFSIYGGMDKGVMDNGGSVADVISVHGLILDSRIAKAYAAAECAGTSLVERGKDAKNKKDWLRLSRDVAICQVDLARGRYERYAQGMKEAREIAYNMPTPFSSKFRKQMIPNDLVSIRLLLKQEEELRTRLERLFVEYEGLYEQAVKGNEIVDSMHALYGRLEAYFFDPNDHSLDGLGLKDRLNVQLDKMESEIRKALFLSKNPNPQIKILKVPGNDLTLLHALIASEEELIERCESLIANHPGKRLERAAKQLLKILGIISGHLSEETQGAISELFKTRSIDPLHDDLELIEEHKLDAIKLLDAIVKLLKPEDFNNKLSVTSWATLVETFMQLRQRTHEVDPHSPNEMVALINDLERFHQKDIIPLHQDIHSSMAPAPEPVRMRTTAEKCTLVCDILCCNSESRKPYLDPTQHSTFPHQVAQIHEQMQATDTKHNRIYWVHYLVLTFLACTILGFIEYAYLHKPWVVFGVNAALLGLIPLRSLTGKMLKSTEKELNRLRLREGIFLGPLYMRGILTPDDKLHFVPVEETAEIAAQRAAMLARVDAGKPIPRSLVRLPSDLSHFF